MLPLMKWIGIADRLRGGIDRTFTLPTGNRRAKVEDQCAWAGDASRAAPIVMAPVMGTSGDGS